ncbi:hypothetical protein [Aliifodinibius salipaludis]|nr:hypothetical protein [Aliifodinibius salipaludis]
MPAHCFFGSTLSYLLVMSIRTTFGPVMIGLFRNFEALEASDAHG